MIQIQLIFMQRGERDLCWLFSEGLLQAFPYKSKHNLLTFVQV